MSRRFSIVTPVYDPPADVLRETIESVRDQTFTDWELILVDDKSPSPHVIEILRSYAELDPRILVVERSENGGIVAASNDGLARATGEFIGLLDHDDTLVVEALRLVDMYARTHRKMDYCYSDEDLISPDGNCIAPFYKPEWSPERLRAQNYCTHFSVFRATLLDDIGGFREGFDGSQDYDIILRACEAARQVVHIPFVLYHWRQIHTSVAMGDPSVKPYAYEAGRRAVQEHCDRIGVEADVDVGVVAGNYRVRGRVPTGSLTSVIIPTSGASGRVWGITRCFAVEAIRSIVASTSRPIEFVIVAAADTPAAAVGAMQRAAGDVPVTVVDVGSERAVADGTRNDSEMSNLGAAMAAGEFLLLLRDSIEVITTEFLDELLSLAARPDVGAVGCKTRFSDARVRSGGYVLNGNPHEIFQGARADDVGSRGLLVVPREVAGVSGACMLVRRDVFFEAGGLCPALPHDFNDVDLGLKLRRLGLDRVWTPHVEVYDFSSVVDPAAPTAARQYLGRRWSYQLEQDPYYNPNLQLDRNDWVEQGLR